MKERDGCPAGIPIPGQDEELSREQWLGEKKIMKNFVTANRAVNIGKDGGLVTEDVKNRRHSTVRGGAAREVFCAKEYSSARPK